MKECLNYKRIRGTTIECQTCSHFCSIAEGQTGICGIRQNIGGKLYLLPYGKVAAAHIDPIEKKPLFHFFPGSTVLSFGTKGCNFRCDNCQNHEISHIGGVKGDVSKYGKVHWGEPLATEEIVMQAWKSGCRSIAYTYTEPTVFLEYCLDTMKMAKDKGLMNVWVSNGYMSEQTLNLIIPYLDAINVDIKSMDNEFYQSMCGGRVRPVLDNCRRLAQEKVWLEVTTLVIPTLSDDEQMLRSIAEFIKNELGTHVPWHVSAFSGGLSWKLLHLPSTSEAMIRRAYEIGKESGLKHVYAGNIWDSQLESTYCSKCGRMVVERTTYELRRYDHQGRCPGCKKEIEGVFELESES